MARETQAEREKRWRTESDASCLKQYAEICGDKERLKLAQDLLEKEQSKIQAAITSMQVTQNIRAASGKY